MFADIEFKGGLKVSRPQDYKFLTPDMSAAYDAVEEQIEELKSHNYENDLAMTMLMITCRERKLDRKWRLRCFILSC